MVLQFTLGFVIDMWYDQNRAEIPWHDRLHAAIGIVLYLAAKATIILGLISFKTYEPELSIGWVIAVGVWIFLSVLVFAVKRPLSEKYAHGLPVIAHSQ